MLLALCSRLIVQARQQEEALPATLESEVENEAAGTDVVPEDDADWQRLHAWSKHRIQLNEADEATLQSLGLLTPLEISNLLQYRQLLGDLLSIYELQAVPGFEPEVIQRILPYVRVGNDLEPHYRLQDYFRKGDHVFLLRYGRPLEKAKGYLRIDSTPPHYSGSPDKVFMRYRYSFPRYTSWGITMEKDAGESFFTGAQKRGFDFYSAHLFIQHYGKIKALALGDFTINMGQGLLNWQAQANGKGGAVMQVKREGEILRPYTSAGEYYFYRGAAVTLQQHAFQLTAFASLRKLDGTIQEVDTLMDELTASALISTGYHRSPQEIAKRASLQQISSGGNICYHARRWQVGGNVLFHQLTPPLQKKQAPYNQFEFNGKQLLSASIDYAGSWKNVHLFGEAAMSDNGKPALVQGLLTSVAPAVDMALVYRYYDKGYQSLYAKGFGDNYRTINESGLYTAVTVKMNTHLQVDAFADIFHFPWLKYRANAPSGGKELLLRATYTPDKRKALLVQYKYRQSAENTLLPGNPVKVLSDITSTHIRIQWNMTMNKQLETKTRLERSSYQTVSGAQQGWMIYQDASYRFKCIPFSINARVAYFFTGSYDTRIYAYERSVLYENAVSMLYGRGWQYYLNVKWKINRQLSCWFRFHQTVYPGVSSIGSSWDAIEGDRKTMFQFQALHSF
ncbi:hypothetical protein MMC2321_03976 [Chitinophaga sp. MM2321]